MKIVDVKELNEPSKEELFNLWNKEYPKNLNYLNLSKLDNYLNTLKDQKHLLLINNKGEINGWYFDFIRENERWFGMILDSSIQKKGWGTKLLNQAKQKRTTLNGWVIDHENDLKKDGSSYASPLEFYKKNGFTIQFSQRLETDFISAVKIHYSNYKTRT